MAKLTGAKKKAFLERMAKGRRKAKRANPKAGKRRKKKPGKRKPAAKKTPKKRKTSSTQVNRKKNPRPRAESHGHRFALRARAGFPL